MCVVSMIMKSAEQWWPPYQPWVSPPTFGPGPYEGPTKEQVEELINLLKAAKKFDDATGQPDCEIEEKKDTIRKLAEWAGVPLSKVDDIWEKK